ncbi:hypothetical protein N0V87_009961 [Didymella glomerata]|uniref:Protein kinase domain-containing protein n=1 Tax=Didymella glomerata TaxID=749621 RepID=A0A9W8WQN3_9PLEO|nr:hypothetical protein N0V87_009961 [Didymella glomerata]
MSTETQDSNRANTLDDNDGPQLNKWFFGRHGDLKPENILWYPIEGSRYGILKIADFGSTRFSEEKTKYGIVPNSMTYQSPEFNLRGRFGIACDIWALGCVYLLFATWYFGGMKAIDKFGKDRLQPDKTLDMNVDMFFTLDDSEQPPKAFVKLAVQKKILDLRALLANSPKIRVQFTALINLLENDMLVVNHEDEDRNPTEDTMKGFSEYRTGIRLEHSLSPSSQSRTRKSCGHVMRALGDYCRPSGEQTRQSTFNTP